MKALCPVLLLAAILPAQTPCGPFEVLPVPIDPTWLRADFEDVVALPGGEAFAVGTAVVPATPWPPENVTLAMHFDGTSWNHTPTPYTAPSAGLANDYLHAVDALGPNDIWAAGERWGDAGGLSSGAWLLALHWDGSDWQQMPVPPPPGGTGINFSGPRIYDIAAITSDDVWFAGMWAEPNALAAVTWRPLAMHWDGSSMTIADTPVLFSGTDPLHATSIDAVASDDVWAVCRSNTAGGSTNALFVLHYDGSDWTRVPTPSVSGNIVMDEIVARASDDVWVFGRVPFGAPLAFHFDGSTWTRVNEVPAVFAAGVAEGGMYLGDSDLHFFDGTTSAVVANLGELTLPKLFDVDAADSCNVWAVGRRFELGRDYVPLAVRSTSGQQIAASCTLRNGSGTNPTGFACATDPAIGTTWQAAIPTAPETVGTWLVLSPQANQGTPLLGGELLVGLGAGAFLVPGFGTHSVSIPDSGFLIGVLLHAQGLRADLVNGSTRVVLFNAQEVLLGV